MLKKPMLSVAQVKHTSDIGRNLDQIQEFLKEHEQAEMTVLGGYRTAMTC